MYPIVIPAQQTANRRAKFGWLPLSDVAAVTKPIREPRWNLQGCPKPANRSRPLVGRSSPYCKRMWGGILLFNTVFPIVQTYLSSEDIARQTCAIVRRWRFFCVLYFQLAACSTFQTSILNSHYNHIMCRSVIDIQSATAEIRRGMKKNKKDIRKIETTGQKYNVRIYYAGRP